MGMRLSFFTVDTAQVESLSENAEALQELLLKGGSNGRLDLDKAWHGIHFLINGSAWPTDADHCQVIFGGREIGPDLGYGPARVFSAEEVAELSSRLSALPPESLRDHYDPIAMAKEGIYPNVWEREGNGGLEWLLEEYGRLMDYYADAANGGKALILAIM